MSTTLRIYLSGCANQDSASWALFNPQWQLTAQGKSDTRWPKAKWTELVLPAGHTRFTQLELPPMRQPNNATLGFALEDQLANDPANNAYLLGRKIEEGVFLLAISAIAPLKQALAWFKQHGREIDRIIPEEMLLPKPDPKSWVCATTPDGWIVRVDEAQAFYVPTVAECLFDSLRAAFSPQALVVCGAMPLPKPLADLPVQRLFLDWQRAEAQTSYDFAQHALFSGHWWRRRHWKRAIKRAGWVLFALIAAEALFFTGEMGWNVWRKWALERQIIADAAVLQIKTASSNDAVIQARAALDRLHRQYGVTQYDGALQLMLALNEVLKAEEEPRFLALHYQEGQLVAQLDQAVEEKMLKVWQAQLAKKHLSLTMPDDGQLLLTRGP